MRSFITGNPYFEVDMSDVAAKIEFARAALRQKQFEALMHRTFAEVGRKSKSLIAKEVQKDYQVTQSWVRSQIKGYRLGFGGAAAVTCVIPISGHKGIVGGRFKARGLRNGRISANIVKTGRSRLPSRMNNQGGNPPFMAKGLAFTRRTKARLPIVCVAALAVPQMPMNRSDTKVQEALLDFAGKRLDHNFMHMFAGK